MTASDITDPGFPCDSPLKRWIRWRTPKYVPTVSTRATIPVPSHFQGKRFSAWNATVCHPLGSDDGAARRRSFTLPNFDLFGQFLNRGEARGGVPLQALAHDPAQRLGNMSVN